MKKILAIFILLSTGISQAQSSIPSNYFKNPLDIDLVLAGYFGELRSNHFHSGFDIKTQQRQGINVIAAGDGYISRINISNYGYGKALYIQHPNGYTTVYGHLKKFSPEIEAYIKKLQYAKESYEIEVFPEAKDLPLNQGDLIAYSGNTGGSGGPHLHFEIRDGQQRPMNPALFGIDIKDTQAPIINSLYVYPLGEEAQVNGSAQRQRLKLTPLSDGSFKAEEIDACGEIGFGISTFDRQDGAPNQNGIYKIETKLNGDKVFEIKMDKFSFVETRHINQLIDYEYYSSNNSRITKLYRGSNNPLSIYEEVVNNGTLDIKDSLDYMFNISVADFKGNIKMIRIPIKGKQSLIRNPKTIKKTDYFVQANEAFSTENGPIDVYIPKSSLYEDTYLDIEFKGDTIYLDEDNIPIQNYITIGFDVSKYNAEDQDKMFIAKLNKRGKPTYSSTKKKANRFTTGVRNFGTYTLASDKNAPSIYPVNFKDGQWISSNKDISLKISDDLSGINSFRATVNGKWILMEYEYKNNTITHDFSDDVVTETENLLKVIVTDNVGNSKTYEATFFRK